MRQMARILAAFAACLLLSAALAQPGGGEVVLVASVRSPITRLAREEARNLYLGLPMLVDGRPVEPLRNYADSVTNEAFMQKFMFMSTPAYERQILSRVFRTGGSRPPVFNELPELLKALRENPVAVSYMLRERAASLPELKIIGTP
jgi:hypothetical protein